MGKSEKGNDATNQNVNEGRQNTFENSGEIRVEGRMEFSQDVKQVNTQEKTEVAIQDPSGLNNRVDFYQTLLRMLPIPSDKVPLTFGGSGLFGTLITLLYILGVLPGSAQYSLPQMIPVWLLTVGMLLGVIGGGYFFVREDSSCPECETPFAIETTETVKYVELSDEEMVRGRQTRECSNCGYSVTEDPKEWPRKQESN